MGGGINPNHLCSSVGEDIEVREEEKSMLKVLQVHTNDSWGGGENQVFSLLKGLRENSVEYMLAARQDGKLFCKAREEGLNVYGMRGKGPGLLDFSGRKKMLDAAARFAPDIIHAHDSKALSLAERVGSRLSVPVVLSRRIASRLRNNFLSKRKYSPERVKMVLAISETVRDVMISCGYPSERIEVVPSGLDPEMYACLEPAEGFREEYAGKFLVGGLGKLSVKKNWQMLVRTAGRVREKGLDVRWVIVGDGRERASLEELARREGVGDIVSFTGFREDGRRVLKSLDLLFFPSKMEGASVTVREAMFLGVPVVAVNAPGTMESLSGHGWGVDDGDIAGACDAVVEALTDSAVRAKKTHGARELALKKYNIGNTIKLTIEAYRKVLGR